jgi:hypothetical protein
MEDSVRYMKTRPRPPRLFVSTFVEDKTDVGFSHTMVSGAPFEERTPGGEEFLRRAAARRLVLGILRETRSFVRTHGHVWQSPEHADALDYYATDRLEDTICLLRDSARSGA